MHVLIVGAGLGGLSLAQMLRKQGITFEIFERDADASARSQGQCIALYSIVDALVASYPSDMPDIRAAVNHLVPLQIPAQITVYTAGNEERFGYEDAPHLPLIRAERRKLRSWLSTNIPVQWGKRVMQVQHDDDAVTVQFEDGGSAKGDILVAADGINSIVRQQFINRQTKHLLNVIPLATIIGELELSGDAFKRQLSLGHSGIMCLRPDLGFVSFEGLHYVHPDGLSARYYWNVMEHDANVAKPNHWLQTASQQEKLDHVLALTANLPPKLREIFELTKAHEVRTAQHVWRDLELDRGSVPDGRVALMGDAAHAMMPIRGEGGYHTLVDSLVLGKTLGYLAAEGRFRSASAVKQAVADYHDKMIHRGGQAVRDSRRLDLTAKRYGPDGNVLTDAEVPILKPLPDMDIELGVQVA